MRRRSIVLQRMLAFVGALGLILASCGSPPSVTAPSPTPTASPMLTSAPTATTSPTIAPTPTPTPLQRTPEPTISYDAGSRMIPFYFQIRPMFPLLAPAPVILPDDDATEENATFRGLNVQGEPQFSVRHTFVIDKGTTAHEMGHAYEAALRRRDPSRDWLALYWAFRGFPGSWQDAQAESSAQTYPMPRWITDPHESWAEAFRAAVTLEVKEKTLDYGRTIDPLATREFFISLASK